MAKSGLKITGDKKLDKKLRNMEKKVGKKLLRKALRQTAKEFQKEWKANAPVGETGETKKNIKVRSGARSRSTMTMNAGASATDAAGVFAAAFTEYGTSKQPAQSHGRRAFESKKESAKDDLIKRLWDGIEAIAEEK